MAGKQGGKASADISATVQPGIKSSGIAEQRLKDQLDTSAQTIRARRVGNDDKRFLRGPDEDAGKSYFILPSANHKIHSRMIVYTGLYAL